MQGLVTKKHSNIFEVTAGKEVYACTARGNLKKEGIFVGDKVNFSKKDLVVNDVLPRKNCLIRPPIANLDTMIIVVAPKPKPDLYLVDKLILFCFVKGIKPILCVNKIDEKPEFLSEIKNIYSKVLKVVCASAKDGVTSEVESVVKGISAFAGQSAVGKSSLINAIFKEEKEKVGDFAKRVERGKQTTRTVSLYAFKKSYIADTAGFSKLDEDLINLEPNEIARYYPDFLAFIEGCKFRSCLHKNSNCCEVIKAVNSGKISKERHENYLKFLQVKLDQKKVK